MLNANNARNILCSHVPIYEFNATNGPLERERLIRRKGKYLQVCFLVSMITLCVSLSLSLRVTPTCRWRDQFHGHRRESSCFSVIFPLCDGGQPLLVCETGSNVIEEVSLVVIVVLEMERDVCWWFELSSVGRWEDVGWANWNLFSIEAVVIKKKHAWTTKTRAKGLNERKREKGLEIRE